MGQECKKKYWLRFQISFRKRHSRVIAGIILFAMLLQYCPFVLMEKVGEDFSRNASAENVEILFNDDYTELYDGANGKIVVDLNTLDFVFKPEEDGAWALDVHGEIKGNPAFTFDVLIYEWLHGNTWTRIDYLTGPGIFRGGDNTDLYREIIPQYYQKGHVYRIKLSPWKYNSSVDADCLKMQYTFQRTEFAGDYNGLIWRTDSNLVGYDNHDDVNEKIRCIRYIGNEAVLQVPDQIEGHLVYAIGSAGGNHNLSNEYLQVLILGENVDEINSLTGCDILKDIYIYNKECSLVNQVLPVYHGKDNKKYYDTVIHGYPGGELERDCQEKEYPFEPLPEFVSPSPDSSDMPAPTLQPSTAESSVTPLPAPTAESSVTPLPAPTAESSATPLPAPTAESSIAPLPAPTAESSIAPLPAPTETPDVAAPTPDNTQMPAPQPTEPDGNSTPPAETENPGSVSPSPSITPKPTKPGSNSTLPVETEDPDFATANPGTSSPLPTNPADDTVLPSPSGNGSVVSVATDVPLAKPAVIPALPNLKASTDHYTRVTLTWKAIPGTVYQIYRTASRDSDYKLLKRGITKTRYQDTTVKSGKSYYYRVCAVKTEGGRQIVVAESRIKRVKIRALARPTIQIQKRQTGNIRYLIIQLQKYRGKWVEIYYKESQWSSYRKIKLYENRIGKQKRTFRIQCMSTKRSLYLKVRTYQKRKGRKVYSTYTKEKKIRI